MNELNPELLIDLARLVRKYEPASFLRLADALENPRTRAQILSFFRALDKLAEELRRKPYDRDMINSSTEAEFERGSLLSKLRSDLNKRSLRELIDIATRFELEIDRRPVRADLTSRIMHKISSLPTAEIRGRIPAAFVEGSRDETEYRRWVALIMGKHAK